MPKTDERVNKRRVTMRSAFLAGQDDEGKPIIRVAEAVDYVRPDFLDVYVDDARTRWQFVEVSDDPDAGPAGYGGATFVPGHLSHQLAGTFYPAFDCGPDCSHAPEGARVVYIAPQEG